MALTISLDELLAWTDEERVKWQVWLAANPTALDVTVQPGGRFPTVGGLIDHIFLIEQRHARRLKRMDLPTASGLAPGNIDGLFGYGVNTRAEVRAYLPTLGDEDAATPRDVVVASGSYSLTPRKLLFHMVLHEVR